MVLPARTAISERQKLPGSAKAERGKIEQKIRTEAILFPKDQAALTPKVTSPVRTFYVNRGSKVHRGQLLAVLENRDLAASVTDTHGAYEQAEGTDLAALAAKKVSITPLRLDLTDYDSRLRFEEAFAKR